MHSVRCSCFMHVPCPGTASLQSGSGRRALSARTPHRGRERSRRCRDVSGKWIFRNNGSGDGAAEEAWRAADGQSWMGDNDRSFHGGTEPKSPASGASQEPRQVVGGVLVVVVGGLTGTLGCGDQLMRAKVRTRAPAPLAFLMQARAGPPPRRCRCL